MTKTKPITDFNWGKKFTELQEKQGKLGTQKALISRSFIAHAIDQAISKAREEELDKIIDAVKKSYETQRDFNGDIESRGIAYGWNNCLDFIQSLIQKDK